MNSIVLPPFILGEDEIEEKMVEILWGRGKLS
jgi:hypothetical protein